MLFREIDFRAMALAEKFLDGPLVVLVGFEEIPLDLDQLAAELLGVRELEFIDESESFQQTVAFGFVFIRLGDHRGPELGFLFIPCRLCLRLLDREMPPEIDGGENSYAGESKPFPCIGLERTDLCNAHANG